eukprot:g10492.t1
MAALASIYDTLKDGDSQKDTNMDVEAQTSSSAAASSSAGGEKEAELFGKKRTLDAKMIAEEYKIWKKNTPFLYDLVLTHALEWPSLTCEFLPSLQQNKGDCYNTHRLLLGTHTSTGENNALIVAKVNLPKDEASLSAEEIERINMGQGYSDVDSKIVFEKWINHPGEVNLARYMPQDPDIIATKSISGDILLFDLKDYPVLSNGRKSKGDSVNVSSVCKGHKKDGYALEWNPNKKGLLLSGADDALICSWQVDMNKGENKGTVYEEHTDVVEDVSWHKVNPNVFASVSDDKSLIIWDMRESGVAPKTVLKKAHEKEANAVDWSPFKEDILLTAGSDHVVKLWDTRKLKGSEPLHIFRGHDSEIYNLKWSPHMDTVFLSGSSDRRVYVWDLSRIGAEQSMEDEEEGPAELLFIHGGHTDKINDACWNLNEDWVVASVSEDNILQVWAMGENIYNPGYAIDKNAM